MPFIGFRDTLMGPFDQEEAWDDGSRGERMKTALMAGLASAVMAPGGMAAPTGGMGGMNGGMMGGGMGEMSGGMIGGNMQGMHEQMHDQCPCCQGDDPST
jgi:hypothetical protein